MDFRPVLAAIAIVTSGCGTVVPDKTSDAQSLPGDGEGEAQGSAASGNAAAQNPTYSVPENPVFHMASLTGVLERVQDCAVIRKGDVRFLLVLPRNVDAGFEGGNFVFGEQRIKIGSEVEAGGSESGGPQVDADLKGSQCESGAVWTVPPLGLNPR